MGIRIDKEFRSLIPPLSAEEREQLEANIRADGCRDPLVVWEGRLLDGHNRYEICQRLKKTFRVVVQDCADRDAALMWIIHNQFGRRNLPPFARAELALKLEPMIAAKAAENRAHGKTAPGKTLSRIGDKAITPVNTKAELGRVAGLHGATIAKAKAIVERAPEPVKAALRAGATTINRRSLHPSARGIVACAQTRNTPTFRYQPSLSAAIRLPEIRRSTITRYQIAPDSAAGARHNACYTVQLHLNRETRRWQH